MAYWRNAGIVIALCATIAVAIDTDFHSPPNDEYYDESYAEFPIHYGSVSTNEQFSQQLQEFERRRPVFYPIMPYHPFYPHHYPSQDADEFQTIEAVRRGDYNFETASEEVLKNHFDQEYSNQKSSATENYENVRQDSRGPPKPHISSNTRYPKPIGPFHYGNPSLHYPYNINKFNGDIKNKPWYFGYQKPQLFSHGNFKDIPYRPFHHGHSYPHFSLNSEKYGKRPFGPVSHANSEEKINGNENKAPHLPLNVEHSGESHEEVIKKPLHNGLKYFPFNINKFNVQIANKPSYFGYTEDYNKGPFGPVSHGNSEEITKEHEINHQHFPLNIEYFRESNKEVLNKPFHDGPKHLSSNIDTFNGAITNKPSYFGYQKPQFFPHKNFKDLFNRPFHHGYYKQDFPINTENYGKGPANYHRNLQKTTKEHGTNNKYLPFNIDHFGESNKEVLNNPLHEESKHLPFNINKFIGEITNKPSYFGYQTPPFFSHGNFKDFNSPLHQGYSNPQYFLNFENNNKFPFGHFHHGHNYLPFPYNKENSEKTNEEGPRKPFHYIPHIPFFTPIHRNPEFHIYENVANNHVSDYGDTNKESLGYYSDKSHNSLFESLFNAETNYIKPSDIFNFFLEHLEHGCYHHHGHDKPQDDGGSHELLEENEDVVEGSGEDEIIPLGGYSVNINLLKDD